MNNKEVNKSLAIKLLSQKIKERREQQKSKPSEKRSNPKKGSKPPKSKVASKVKGLRIIPLGGQEEVGRNMTVFEYGEDIVILDMGIQFPEEDMPGVDYIVPDVSYLENKKDRIRGVIFSHGHLDHIGAAPILLKKLDYPTILGRDFTLALIKKKMEDYEKDSVGRLKIINLKNIEQKISLGSFKVSFFKVEHSVMDAVGVILETPEGTVIHPGDWTIGRDEKGQRTVSYENLADLPRPTVLMLESLGALHKDDRHTPDSKIYENLEKIIGNPTGKVIIATFSSQVERIGKILEICHRLGKKVALDGYSMKTNIEIARQLGYIKPAKDVLIDIKDVGKYPENKLVIICTGAQGEDNAVLARMVNGNHRYIKINKQDSIVFSSSVIPGNERTIQRLKDNLYRKCDNVIHTDIMDVHISGHCSASDIQAVLKQIKPDYYLPVYANHFFLKEAAKLAVEIGFKKENIFVLDNGNILQLQNKKAEIIKEKAKTDYIFIDGLGVGDIGQVVLRDRQVLAQDGMFVITVLIDSKTKKISGGIQITSRGFIYVKENFDLVNATKEVVKKVVAKNTNKDDKSKINWVMISNEIREEVGKFLFKKTERRPMVLPNVIEI
ncbi:MAG: ribonuclease J [Candidatus Moranbacteria bacterium]|jgi:ribonuclease J|nr:ribonuclease J [Candidatus Moranbacteria bacterium]NCA93677.1 ribonuclease J [Sphingobacteriia bacterium]NLC31272.1 ribonuclease J [Candidatus Moranbacteria bacterium]